MGCRSSTLMSQSPINIYTSLLVQKPYPPLKWSKNFFETPIRICMYGGNSLTVRPEYGSGICNAPLLSGGPLKANYQLAQFHYHWSQSDFPGGSEHTIDDNRYLMELHALHIKEGLTQEQALEDAHGFAVVGYLYEYGEKPDAALCKMSHDLEAVNNSSKEYPVVLQKPFPMCEVLHQFSSNYFTYRGSLTTEPFAENVTWIIAPGPSSVTWTQMRDLRRLSTKTCPSMFSTAVSPNNFRHIQELNDRHVYEAILSDCCKPKQLTCSPC